ncbi:hypothetical protein BOS5A_230482 [Bosea sp. EC-HK365B]|nr:hypothetical protein BOS5A_230482 [Bosea sp. EC-HK365B]VXB24562.1 hypothetical protein BOSE127_110107 [Bosea sp. 127]
MARLFPSVNAAMRCERFAKPLGDR